MLLLSDIPFAPNATGLDWFILGVLCVASIVWIPAAVIAAIRILAGLIIGVSKLLEYASTPGKAFRAVELVGLLAVGAVATYIFFIILD